MEITVGILGFLLVVAVLIIVFLGDFRQAGQLYISNNNGNNGVSESNYSEEEQAKFKKEIKRQKLIIDELKRRAEEERKNHKIVSKQQNTSAEMIDLARQKQIIEQEKVLFQEKNKKLWDQSIAIHKEKDRIDILRKNIETKHNEIVDSINYAKRIQTALVTTKEYIDEYLDDYCVFWKPRNVVSGDFYWAKQIDTGLLVVVSDCTGHGVPGAFMSLLGISFLNEITAHNLTIDPVEILEQLRVKVKYSLKQNDNMYTNKDGMDMACILINKDTKTIKFAGANNPMWMFRDNEIIDFSAVKNPVGIFRKEKNFAQELINYREDDIIYLFSDGYADQFGGEKDTKYKRVNFKNFLLNISQQKLKMNSVADSLEHNFNAWKGDSSQTDDVIVMGIRL